MIRRSTWIVLIIFILLAAFALFWERSGNTEESAPTATPQISLLNLDINGVDRLEIIAIHGENISFGKDSSGNWAIEEPIGEVDPEKDLGSIIERFLAVQALSVLEVAPPAEATGLNVPAYTVTLFLKDGNRSIIKIGTVTVTGSGYYVQVGDKAFVVDKFTVDGLLDLLQNTPYITPEVDNQLSSATPSP